MPPNFAFGPGTALGLLLSHRTPLRGEMFGEELAFG